MFRRTNCSLRLTFSVSLVVKQSSRPASNACVGESLSMIPENSTSLHGLQRGYGLYALMNHDYDQAYPERLKRWFARLFYFLVSFFRSVVLRSRLRELGGFTDRRAGEVHSFLLLSNSCLLA
ncbi:hypothetical protein EJ02DRAFT_26371 [Clathrospora elynae]|uniref:Uncharacterized protein n=1 Tax=Clathrospora elynae TaxID=706981 RepID=A0A6A5T0V7_9PLEO|nr:hypothetical protein EJ02DRAFT_26371 [Clathrospora elynae]